MKKTKTKMSVIVTLNGGPVNVWHVWDLTCNPFPQIGRYEYAAADRLLQLLDSDPLTSTDQIRTIMKGCSQEFIDKCCDEFVPGKRIAFRASWYE